MNTDSIAPVSQKFCVIGMTCHHCEMAVTSELSKLDGVTRVVVDVAAGTVITESEHPLDRDDVAAAIDDAGYELA
jgi:copper chaperone CopZ